MRRLLIPEIRKDFVLQIAMQWHEIRGVMQCDAVNIYKHKSNLKYY